ncbi:hypothetical protein [Helicobacter bilis]|uniref:hypothetical protein n=1 Tax=Helicobacter bilis TaxID=37372 RepID=UPI0012DB4F21|nr:hypothetical protein [Helicobacter bilis]
MIQTKNLTLKKFQENFDFIEAKMKDSQIYKDALDSFVKYMPNAPIQQVLQDLSKKKME